MLEADPTVLAGMATRPPPILRATPCSRAWTVLAWLGIAHALFWAVMLVRPLPVAAQPMATRVTQTEQAVAALDRSMAVFSERLNNFEKKQNDQTATMATIDAKLNRLLEGVVGLLVAIAGALITVVWGLRGRWTPPRIITE
jgi:hypothetical protein